jgi:hypothetical protein
MYSSHIVILPAGAGIAYPGRFGAGSSMVGSLANHWAFAYTGHAAEKIRPHCGIIPERRGNAAIQAAILDPARRAAYIAAMTTRFAAPNFRRRRATTARARFRV